MHYKHRKKRYLRNGVYPGLWVLVVCANRGNAQAGAEDQDKAQGPDRILQVACLS